MKILITGGTGSFGQYMTEHLLKNTSDEIIIFSRDEQKQEDMWRKHDCNTSSQQSNKVKEVFDCGCHWYKLMPKRFKERVGLSDFEMYLINRKRMLKSLAIYYKNRGADKWKRKWMD